MRTIEAALWPLEKPADPFGLGVYLGEEHAPDLDNLQDGERVMLVEPNELCAAATVHRLTLDGRLVWFAEIGDREAIEVIYPDSQADAPSTKEYHDQDTSTLAR